MTYPWPWDQRYCLKQQVHDHYQPCQYPKKRSPIKVGGRSQHVGEIFFFQVILSQGALKWPTCWIDSNIWRLAMLGPCWCINHINHMFSILWVWASAKSWCWITAVRLLTKKVWKTELWGFFAQHPFWKMLISLGMFHQISACSTSATIIRSKDE